MAKNDALSHRGVGARARLMACGLTIAVAALAAGGCGGGDDKASDDDGPTGENVALTVWSWAPQTEEAVRLFERDNPNVKVKVVNAGSGADEYTKFRAALEAGKGAPDVIMLEIFALRQFVVSEGIRDLSEHGVDQSMDGFAPWYAQLLAQNGDGVYGLPIDAGLMGFIYRKDVFDKHGLLPPKTWAEFADVGGKLRDVAPESYISSFPLSSGGFLFPLMWQAGARPFKVDGENITIDLDSPEALKVAAYWDDLIKRGIVKPDPSFTSRWFSAIDRGTYAGLLAAQWLPVLIKGTSDTYGKWRVAPLPQWSASENVQPLLSGSVYSVTSQSEHPAEAAELVKYMTSQEEVVRTVSKAVPYAFYPLKSVYESDEWKDQALPFYGDQKANRVFADAAPHVQGDYQFSPFEDYLNVQADQLIGEALENGTPLVDAIRKLQGIIVDYAEKQGFTVNP